MKTTAEHSTSSATRSPRNSDQQSHFFSPTREENGTATAEPFFQPKLKVGAPNDKYEQEADAVADQVVQRMAEEKARPQVQSKVETSKEPAVQRAVVAPSLVPLPISRIQRSVEPEAEEKAEPEGEEVALQRKPIFDSDGEGTVQRKCDACSANEEEGHVHRFPAVDVPTGIQRKCSACEAEEKIQPKAMPTLQRSGDGGFTASSDFSSQLASSRGGGSPLPAETRTSMESGIGADFSGVRIHTGSKAANLSSQIGAQAFTHGSDVYFNEGKYDPGSTGGQRLLAHELTHTVQQGSVKRKPLDEASPNFAKGGDVVDIQRTHYWTPMGISKAQSGTAIHSELTKAIVANNSGVDREVSIPNADRNKNVGYGIKGQADLYKGTKVGLYFDQKRGEGIPKTLRGSGKSGRPKVSKGKINNIAQGPTDITLGELKPADKGQITFGEAQLDSYERGIGFARDETNAWSTRETKPGTTADQWAAPNFSRLTAANLAIPDKYKYDASNPKTDINVGVGTYRGLGERVVLEFNPYKKLRRHVKGGLYAMMKPNGLVVYFARPADPAGALSGLNPTSLASAVAVHATTLQNEVISPLTAPPEKIQLKKKPGSQRVMPAKVSPATTSLQPRIQRKQKRYKLIDKFKLPAWKKAQKSVHAGFRGKTNSGLRNKTEFLKYIYESEESLKNIGVSQPSGSNRLPGRGKDAVNIPAPKSGGKKKTKNLPDLYNWLNVWTLPGVGIIGTLRKKFGGAFVKVSDRVNRLKIKLQEKVQKAKKRGSKKGFSYGKIAVRAFWRAAVKIAGMVFTKMTDLLFTSAEIGIKKNIDKIFPLSPAELQKEVEEGFPQIKEVEAKIDTLEQSVASKIKAVQDKYDADIKKLESYAAAASKYGKYIKWAVIALNCASPPGWGCLKILAKGLIARTVDEVLQWCWTQEEFAGLVLKTGVFNGVPNYLAERVADGVESFLPGRILPLFDRKTLKAPAGLSAANVPCGEAPTAQQMALEELDDELKNKMDAASYQQLLLAMDKYGVDPEKPLTVDQILEIKNNIPEGVTADMIKKYMEENPVPSKEKRKIVDIAVFIAKVKEADALRPQFYYIAHPPRTGHTKYSTVDVTVSFSNNQACQAWESLQPISIKARVTKRIWANESKKLFKILYEAKETKIFMFNGKEQQLKKGDQFWGYRPDVCSNL